MPQATTYRCWQPKVSYRFVTSVCVWKLCVCVCVYRCVWKTKRDYFKNLFIMQWLCVGVWVCVSVFVLVTLALLCSLSRYKNGNSLWFSFARIWWTCVKLSKVVWNVHFVLVPVVVIWRFAAHARGRVTRRELPLVALLQTLCICQADCPTCPLVFPQLSPFLLATRILSALLFFPSCILFPPLSPLLFTVYYSLVVKLNKLLSRGAFLVLTFECFWHLCKFVLISLLHTANWHVCLKWIGRCKGGTSRRPATFGEFSFWIVEKAISLFCQAIHWKVSSGKHSAHSSHPSLWLSTKAFKVLWNLFYSHFLFSGDSLAFFSFSFLNFTSFSTLLLIFSLKKCKNNDKNGSLLVAAAHFAFHLKIVWKVKSETDRKWDRDR